ncbi:hypothetical protein VN97_g12996, partial [Penicillium thymicola]
MTARLINPLNKWPTEQRRDIYTSRAKRPTTVPVVGAPHQ